MGIWNSLGSTGYGNSNKLCVYNGRLYITGNSGDAVGAALLRLKQDETGFETLITHNTIDAQDHYILSLSVYNGKLYGGAGIVMGDLYRLSDTYDSWIKSVNLTTESGGSITSLIVFNDRLYAGCANGNLIKFNVDVTAIDTIYSTGQGTIKCLVEYNSELYIGANRLCKLDVSDIVLVGDIIPNQQYINSMVTHFGKLYCGVGCTDIGKLCKLENDQLEIISPLPSILPYIEYYIISMLSYHSNLYLGGVRGNLFYLNNNDVIEISCPKILDQENIDDLVSFNDRLFAISAQGGLLLEGTYLNKNYKRLITLLKSSE